ncbi:MAG: cyclic nucleotide-binding domain-containing protein [Candidatus Promineofilum sp.]|nr:cyclic nucleotide-binding domain-containing protein [Promineifilum sp.]MCW5863404.1 cyclic nucleotide-binding domain-containing protein [Anaerolineae bacterium]
MIAPAATPYVDARRLIKVFRTPAGDFTALKGIDLQVNRGEFVAIIGKSGSGKSTLINLITGIDRPTAGEIVVGGEPLHTFDEERMAEWRGRNLGIVFQFFQLLPTLTLVENVMLPMDINRLYPAAERRDRAMRLLELVEMDGQARKLPAAVSGGQQQRVAIARALANDPGLLIADEPTGNLDSRTAESIFSLFQRLVTEGKTIIMVTHDEARAARTSRSVMIADGQVVNEHVTQALAALNYDQLAEVQRHVAPTAFAPGSVVVRQGEPGEHFYIITGGRAEVCVEQPDGRTLPVDSLRAGQYFGEMALLGRRPRRATVRAAADTPLEVVALDGATFSQLVESSADLRDELQRIVQLRETQSRVEALADAGRDDAGRDELRRLAAGAPTRTFAPGETIIRQGDLGEAFYLILDGEVDVFVRRGADDALIDHHGPGAYFGELALLGDRRRTATVRVAGTQPARLLELDADAFASLTQLSGRFAADLRAAAAERTARVRGDDR